MTAGETLLKLSEYPFSYSLIGLLATIAGFDISQHHLIFLGVAGGVGTFLTIIDPFGWIVKETIQRKLKNSNDQDAKSLGYEKEYAIQAINTKSIGVEIDKIIGILYFAVTATIFIVAILFSQEFDNHFIISDKNSNATCDAKCVQSVVGSFGGGVTTVLIIVGMSRWKELFDKVTIAGLHQLAISSEYPTINSVENMTRAVDQNDWETAKRWGTKIQDEIINKKGRKDSILKAIDKIYRPLYRESIQIINAQNSLAASDFYSNIETSVWDSIKVNSDDVLMDGGILQDVKSLYDKIYEYRYLVGPVRRKIDEMILKRASETFAKKINRIEYYRRSDSGNREPNLIECAFVNKHPSQYQGIGIPSHFNLHYVKTDGSQEKYEASTEKDFENFDNMWKLVLEDVKNDSTIMKIKDLFTKIQSENLVLNRKYVDKISEEAKL